VTHKVSAGLGLPPDRVELIPPGSIPKTSSGKLRREETRQLYIAGTLSAKKPPAWLQIARLGTIGTVRNVFRNTTRALGRGLEILYGAYFIVLFAVWIVPACAGVLLFRDHRAAGRYTSAVVRLLFFLAGLRVRVVGKEHMNTPGAKIYASNHTSYFDVLPLMGALGVPYRFVAKREVHDMPFIGTFLRKMKHLSFERGDSNSRREAIQEMADTLRDGESVFVFPEGTFVPEEGVRPFQLGAFHTAVSTGVPIVPVSLGGTRRFLRDGTFFPRPTTVTITLSPPVTSTASAANSSDWHEVVRLRDTVREQIARFSGEPLI
jgi:fatty-acyl-CoA synthase